MVIQLTISLRRQKYAIYNIATTTFGWRSVFLLVGILILYFICKNLLFYLLITIILHFNMCTYHAISSVLQTQSSLIALTIDVQQCPTFHVQLTWLPNTNYKVMRYATLPLLPFGCLPVFALAEILRPALNKFFFGQKQILFRYFTTFYYLKIWCIFGCFIFNSILIRNVATP